MEYDSEAFDHLKKLLLIDRDHLDEEMIAQAQHFFHVAEGHEMAVSLTDKRKYDLERLEASLDKEIREQMIADDEKPTEKSVSASIQRDQDYHRAYTDFLSAKRSAGLWGALREAWRQRRDMLRELNTKGSQRFFDDVTGTGDSRRARERFDDRRRGR